MKELGIVGILLWFCVRHGQGGGCKLDVFAKCFGADFRLLGDPENVKNICKPQRLLKSLVCMDNMKTGCEQQLQHEMDTSGWSEAMTLFCDNLDLMVDNANCIKAAGDDLEKCISTIGGDKRNTTMKRDRQLITCEHPEETLNCFDKKLTETCPNDVRAVLSKVSRLKTKATCIFGRYVHTLPTESSMRDTDNQPRPTGSNSSPEKRNPEDPPENSGSRHRLTVLEVLVAVYMLYIL